MSNLSVYDDGTHWAIAETEDEAKGYVEDWSGEAPEDMARVESTKDLTVCCYVGTLETCNCGDGEEVTLTAKEWCAKRGPGFLGKVE